MPLGSLLSGATKVLDGGGISSNKSLRNSISLSLRCNHESLVPFPFALQPSLVTKLFVADVVGNDVFIIELFNG